MKVIFLDVDGVLNKTGTIERSPHGSYGVEQTLISRLRKIVEATDAKIVLSSTWRLYPDMVEYLWEQTGPDIKNRYIGKTIATFSGFRGHEISIFLNQASYDISNFIILDDNTDMGELLPHLLKCNPRTGISEEIVQEAIKHLNNIDKIPFLK